MTSVVLTANELIDFGIYVNQSDMNVGESFSTLTRKYTLVSKNALIDYTFNYTEIPQVVQTFKIEEEDIPTQGYVELLGYDFTVPAGASGARTIFEINIEQAMNVYQIRMVGDARNDGDTVSMWIGPTYAVGTITADLNAGDTYAVVSSYPLANMKLGWTLGLKVGSDPIESAGRIASIDTENSRFYFRHPTTLTAASGTPIYAWIPRGTNIPLFNGSLVYGQGKIGGSHAPKGLRVTFHYTNNDGQQKRFRMICEDTY